jgi:hypothetical protein
MAAQRSVVVDLPTPLPPPKTPDLPLHDAIYLAAKRPAGDAMRIIKSALVGDLEPLTISVHRAAHGPIVRQPIGTSTLQIPERATVMVNDATAAPDSLARAIGCPVVNMTPTGGVKRQQVVVQIPVDNTRGTSRGRLSWIVQQILARLPGFHRLGVITHGNHTKFVRQTFGDRIAKFDHFFGTESRGSNRWIEACDCLIVLGTPRPARDAIRLRLHKNRDAEVLEVDGEWTRGVGSDGKRRGLPAWPARTTSGRVRTVHYRTHPK